MLSAATPGTICHIAGTINSGRFGRKLEARHIARVFHDLGLLQAERGLQDHLDADASREIDLITALQQDRAQTQSSAQAGPGQ